MPTCTSRARERPGDLRSWSEPCFAAEGGERPAISPRAWAALAQYPFPGNVRELMHAVEHAVVLARGGEIDLAQLPRDIVGPGAPADAAEAPLRPLSLAIDEFEHEYLLRALAAAGGKKTRAAEMLGISRKNLWEKLRDHAVSDSDIEE